MPGILTCILVLLYTALYREAREMTHQHTPSYLVRFANLVFSTTVGVELRKAERCTRPWNGLDEIFRTPSFFHFGCVSPPLGFEKTSSGKSFHGVTLRIITWYIQGIR